MTTSSVLPSPTLNSSVTVVTLEMETQASSQKHPWEASCSGDCGMYLRARPEPLRYRRHKSSQVFLYQLADPTTAIATITKDQRL